MRSAYGLALSLVILASHAWAEPISLVTVMGTFSLERHVVEGLQRLNFQYDKLERTDTSEIARLDGITKDMLKKVGIDCDDPAKIKIASTVGLLPVYLFLRAARETALK